MPTNRNLLGTSCRLAAITFLAAASTMFAHAQQAPSAEAAVSPALLASASSPASGSLIATGASSSSSSDSMASVVDNNGTFLLNSAALNASQPPPRRYGRPNYSDSHQNSDGSSKFAFLGGAGLGLPIGNTHKYETPSWGFQIGAGRNFSKSTALIAQFDYDHFGLQGATIANENYIYNYCTAAENGLPISNPGYCAPQGPAPAGTATPVDGNNHVWSFTLNPTFTLTGTGNGGMYVVFGGGFYHKVTNFTTPTLGTYCYYYCEEVQTNSTFDHYTSNAGGVNGGLGFTWKFSQFSNERFYMEARYVVVFDSQRYGVTSRNIASAPLSATDFYPANSNRTTYIPIKFGIRF